MDELLDLESFRSENLFLSDEETLSWFESSALFNNYKTTFKNWD